MSSTTMNTLVRLSLVVTALIFAGGWAYYRENPAGLNMTTAAEKFMATLTPAQQTQAMLAYDTPKRVAWHFVPLAERKGLQVKDMDEAQRKAAHGLLRAALSRSSTCER